MNCTAASYEDKATANDARRSLKRTHNIPVKVRYCELCDCYHFDADLARLKMPKRAMEVLRLKAQGFTGREISSDLNLTKWMVKEYERLLFRLFDANSSNHLIAIAIAVGVLSPNEFVPEVTERTHDARPHGKPRRTRGVVAPVSSRSNGTAARGVAKQSLQS